MRCTTRKKQLQKHGPTILMLQESRVESKLRQSTAAAAAVDDYAAAAIHKQTIGHYKSAFKANSKQRH